MFSAAPSLLARRAAVLRRSSVVGALVLGLAVPDLLAAGPATAHAAAGVATSVVAPASGSTSGAIATGLPLRTTGSRTAYAQAAWTSAPTAVVPRRFDRMTVPTISGTARVGATLTANVRPWSPAARFSFQWRRGDVAIPGATARTYRLAAADHQRLITVTVTGRRPSFATALRTSRATARIAAPLPALTRDGTYRVGSEIRAGIYVTRPTTDSCYWARRSSAGDSGGIIANDIGSGQRIVEIRPTDRFFSTSRCGSWTRLVPMLRPRVSVGEGVFAVGEHLRPGLYQAAGSGSCYWARLAGFSGDSGDLIDNHIGAGQQYVQIHPGDAGFKSTRCGTWRRVGN